MFNRLLHWCSLHSLLLGLSTAYTPELANFSNTVKGIETYRSSDIEIQWGKHDNRLSLWNKENILNRRVGIYWCLSLHKSQQNNIKYNFLLGNMLGLDKGYNSSKPAIHIRQLCCTWGILMTKLRYKKDSQLHTMHHTLFLASSIHQYKYNTPSQGNQSKLSNWNDIEQWKHRLLKFPRSFEYCQE